MAADAQTQDALHTAIMNSLLSDPRTAQIPPAQLQQLVDTLAQQAQAQKVTAQEIAWHPQLVDAAAPAPTTTPSMCPAGFETFCAWSEDFGFIGADITIPIALFVITGVFFLVIRRMHLHHVLEHGAPISSQS